ncbi:MAG: ABC transporter substrate-binding protein [Bacteroidota bacterium]
MIRLICGLETNPPISRYLHSLGILVYLLAFTGCRPNAPKQNTTSYIVRSAASKTQIPLSLHPLKKIGIPAYTYLHLSLTKKINAHEQVPILLKSLPEVSPDLRRISLQLREDVYWPDGQALSPRDVRFSIKAFACPLLNNPAYASYSENLLSIQALADNPNGLTLQVKPYLLNVDLLNDIPILPEHLYDPNQVLTKYTIEDLRKLDSLQQLPDFRSFSEKFGKIGAYEAVNAGTQPFPIGLGPYEVKEWIPEASLILQRKQSYWASDNDTFPVFSQAPAELHFIATDPVQALRNKEVDVVDNLSPKDFISLTSSQADYYEFSLIPESYFLCIALNVNPDPVKGNQLLRSKVFRQALSHAIPVEQIIQTHYGDVSLAKQVALPLDPDLPSYHPHIQPKTYSLSLSDSLLNLLDAQDRNQDGIREVKIGAKDVPTSFHLLFNSNSETSRVVANFLQDALKPLQIECILEGVSTKVYFERARAHEYDAILRGLTFQDHGVDFKQHWHSESWELFGSTGFANATVDSLIEALRIEQDPEKRLLGSHRMQEIIYDEQAYLYLFSPKRGIALGKQFGPVHLRDRVPIVPLNSLEPINGKVPETLSFNKDN